MERILLVLKRSADQEAALERLLVEQLNRSTANYHKWLTPEQFGERFGPSDQDLRTLSSWLTSHGFEGVHTSTGRTVVEFSGNAGQVLEAFHTAIHRYAVNGEEHWANASDPQIPAALAPLVNGINALHSFPPSVSTTIASPCDDALLQPSGACFGIAPYDFASIYNLLPLWKAGIDGTGQDIAILAASSVNVQDIRNFRSLFGLSANDPVILINGRSPGVTNKPQAFETEAVADIEWAGATAPGATIKLVVSADTNGTSGFDLSAVYAVNNNVAPILSASYSFCEQTLGASGNQFHRNLWQQAAAQGITVIIGTGDGGSADCDFENGKATPPGAAESGLTVNGVASTPFNVAVGGTDFRDFTDAFRYWNSANDLSTLASARGYVPESTWNDSCTNGALALPGMTAETNCNRSSQMNFVRTTGGAGGKSTIYGKPSWQTGPGVLPDGSRDIPDVSVFSGSAISGHFFLLCEADMESAIRGANCNFGGAPPSHFFGVAGTSISGPAFAGIMALVAQFTNSRLGNIDPVLYQLGARQTAVNCDAVGPVSAACIFHDVTSGTIAMPCAKSSRNCITANSTNRYGVLSGYDAGPGYDLATGLGSVDAFNLVTAPAAWATNDRSTPSIGDGGIVNAASLTPGPVAPGSIVTVIGSFGLNFPSSSSGYPLPPILSGLALKTGDGYPVPLFFASAAQANIQLPWELAGQTQSSLMAVVGGQTSAPQSIDLTPFAPGIFRMNDQGQGAILDASYRLVDAFNPTTPHAIIQIYCTGLGAVTNRPASGAAAPFDPLAETVEKPSILIGGAPARVIYSGLTPGSAGLYQVNVEVPDGVSKGPAVPVALTIGGAASNTVTIAVQ
jgi:uncharacterized protein (TIGR03437 family)